MKNILRYSLIICSIFSGVSYGISNAVACVTYVGAGSHTFNKNQGINTVCLTHIEKVFSAGGTVEQCPDPQSTGWTRNLPPRSQSDMICNSCIEEAQDRHDLISPGGCIVQDGKTISCYQATYDDYKVYKRTCGELVPGHRSIYNGALFTSGREYDMNVKCGGGTVPSLGLQVSKTESWTTMWDAVSPFCRRIITSGPTVQNGKFYSNEELKQVVLDSIDGTLYYDSLTGSGYNGNWTNRQVWGKWKCEDGDSGCIVSDISSDRPLYNGESTYPVTLEDIAKNRETVSCDSRVIKPTNIKRVCQYKLEKDYMDSSELTAIQSLGKTSIIGNESWYGDLKQFLVLSGGENDYQIIAKIKNLPKLPDGDTSGNTQKFVAVVRALERISYANFNKYHELYSLQEGTCKYTPVYTPENTYPPLIDRILPVVKIQIANGTGMLYQTVQTVLDNDKDISQTGTFIAGPKNIVIRFEDNPESTYSKNPKSQWEHWNGISGLKTISFNIKRIRLHDGTLDNTDIHSDGGTFEDPYNATGAIINTGHYYEFDFSLLDDNSNGIRKAGLYQITYSILDNAGNANTGSAYFEIYPQVLDPNKTTLEKINSLDGIEYSMSGNPMSIWKNPSSPQDEYFANAKDIQKYKVSLYDKYGNPAYNRSIRQIALIDTNPVQIPLDVLATSKESAVIVSGRSDSPTNTATTDNSGSFMLYISSYAPGVYAEKYSFSLCTWGNDYKETSDCSSVQVPNDLDRANTGTFLHIFTGAMNLYTSNRIDLGTKNDIQLDLFPTINTPSRYPDISSFTVSNFMESLRPDSSGFTITHTGTYNGVGPSAYNSDKFAQTTFTPEQISDYASISLLRIHSDPLMAFTLNGISGTKAVRYYLVGTENYFGSGITFGTGQLNRIFIQGNKSLKGKEGYVNPGKSIASINSADIVNLVRKNVGILTRNREANGSIVNRIKYAQGDVRLKDLTDISAWDTLILKEGNLYIESDFNTQKTQKGIIVLANDENEKGHIYIGPNVQFIGATLFAENSMESIGSDNKPIDVSNSQRAKILSNQLVIFGGTYTKNTVGGAVRAGSDSDYVLPWNITDNNKTSELDKAVKYDLAFLRMNNAGSETQRSLNLGHDEFVVILFDERNIISPLPVFTNK